MDQPGPSNQDSRLDFIGSYTTKSLKLKPEKWSRVLTVEEYKTILKDFVDRISPIILIVVLTHSAQLVPCISFPVVLKNKAVFFVKKRPGIVPREECGEMLIYGDLAPRIIDQLASLVDEVFVPLLSNPLNHKQWPAVVAQDILKHVHSLKSTVYEVKGKVNGQTVLPMPVGVELVHEAEKGLLRGEEVDLYLKSAIEGVIIKWASQINDVMMEDSAQSFNNGQNPVPSNEITFWRCRLNNLNYIYDQLRSERVRCMAVILEKTDSAYFPCFSDLFKNIVSALAEAREIDLYLKTLVRHFQALEDTDFTECQPLFRPMFHVICLIWSQSKYYCSSSKLMVLLKQICNLLIYQAKKCLDPSTLFHSDIDEATIRIQITIDILKKYRSTFDYFKEHLGKYFEDRQPVPWTFHPNVVFERMNRFLERLETIQWFFHTVLEFNKLEKIEIGGLKGRILSGRVRDITQEFESYFAAFASKSYDVLDPDDERFDEDFASFQESIVDLDLKLSTVLCEALDNCLTLEAIFKLIDIIGSILDRPLIKKEFTAKYVGILTMLSSELGICEDLFEEQTNRLKKYGSMEVDSFMPPITGGLLYMNMLAARITSPVTNFKSLQDPINQCEEALKIIERYDELMKAIEEFKKKYFSDWAKKIPKQIEDNLNKSIIMRQSNGQELAINFSAALIGILREVHYLRREEEVQPLLPEEALKVFEREETFRKYRINLSITIEWYNQIRKNSQKVEFDLVEDEIKAIDVRVQMGQTSLNWNSPDLWVYLEELHKLAGNLQQRMSKIQDNLKEMKNEMLHWVKQPLFERKEGKKDTTLCVEERNDRTSKRYADIKAASARISGLLDDNMQLFNMKEQQTSEIWLNYVTFIDEMIAEALFKAIGCSLGYLSEHMDAKNNLAPLFEAQLELLEPDIIFNPSLQPNDPKGFNFVIKGLIDDILKMSSLVERVDQRKEYSYEAEIVQHQDVIEMRDEIFNGVSKVIEDANEFIKSFENYSYLWLEERDYIMEMFLAYGRTLTPDELDHMGSDDIPGPELNPPKMDAFRDQIDNYENLFAEIEDMEPFKVFNSWFQVDIRPFRQTLLNTVRKWGNMYKQHLVNNVTSSLSDLATFIRDADEGLLQPVVEGDYQALVTVMAYLMNVKERTLNTDEMFQPLTETIELLKFYDMDIPEEVNVLLQELPEQWQSTKKLAITVKQQVAPLQAAEVTCIRKKIIIFDAHINYYREVFKRYPFFKFDCSDPYMLLDRTDKEILRLEKEMEGIQESGSLFEVNVPEFKMLKQCRKELRMLKQLWDYVYIVRSSIEDWKKTPWRKIDVENMDIECKKFAKEIRLLDKEMRSWDTYVMLEATVKNMLTSLRAVGELQNPAIRERHWDQLMKSTKTHRRIKTEALLGNRIFISVPNMDN